MFLRYLLLRPSYNGKQNWSAILSNRGESHLENFGGLAESLDDEILDNFQQKINNALLVEFFSIGNKGEIIELQSGGYLGEEDIERLDDNYGRS